MKGTLRRTSKSKPHPDHQSNTEPRKVVSTINPKLFIIAKGNIAPRPKSPTDPGMKLSHPKRNFVINKFGTLPRNLTFQEQSFIKTEEDDNKSTKSDSSYISSEEQVTYASSQSSIISSRNDIQSTHSLSNSPSVSRNHLSSIERSCSEDEILNDKNGTMNGKRNFTKSLSPIQMIAPQSKEFIVPKPEKVEMVKSPVHTKFDRSISQDNIEVDGVSNKYNFKRTESVRNGTAPTGLNISHGKRNFTVNGKSSQSPVAIKSPPIFKTVQKIDLSPSEVKTEEPKTPKVDKNFFRSLSLRKPKVPTEKPIFTRQQSKTNEEMQIKVQHVMKMKSNGQIVCEMEQIATKSPVPKTNKIDHGDVNFEKKDCTSFSKDLAIEPNRYPDTVKVTKIVPQEKTIFNRNDPPEFQHLKFDVSSNGELTINKM